MFGFFFLYFLLVKAKLYYSVNNVSKHLLFLFIRFSFSGNPELARQKILSIFYHVTNVHEFSCFDQFGKCEHDEIADERPWLKFGKK